ncbi:MAG: hypothetical protein IJH04_02800 [Eggerthellaceae bacterium]|nr:hypothetical protein [Eggerthellaceae bacterium]
MSTFKLNSIVLASALTLTGALPAHAVDTRGHIVAVDHGQAESHLRNNVPAVEGTRYKVTHYRAGPPKDPTSNVYLYAGRLRVTMPMANGRAHAQILDGTPRPGDSIYEEDAAAQK